MPGVLTVREEGEARRHVFEQQAVIGRDLDCDIPLVSRSVSRRHALVEKTPGGWVARDLGSANGTCVDGARITEAPLVSGAAVRFGEVEALFEIGPRETTGAERLVSSLSIPPVRKARPVAVFVTATVGVILLAAATIWARYCDRAPPRASSAAGAPGLVRDVPARSRDASGVDGRDPALDAETAHARRLKDEKVPEVAGRKGRRAPEPRLRL
jgi:pSer/pThr/pTyr-binding forkhead associated (FHA) protein